MKYSPFDKVRQPPFKMATFSGRENLANLLNKRGLVGTVVEVGVYRGVFAEKFLRLWKGDKYFGIDPWENLPEYQDTISGTDRNVDRAQALTLQQLFGYYRVNFYKSTSQKAVQNFCDGSLDFVYIDANHKREYVAQDIELWWPKIVSGGILAGHDIDFPQGNSPIYRWRVEIEPVLREFATANNLIVYVIKEPGYPWSWYVDKP